jgi:serine/threonine protein kinase
MALDIASGTLLPGGYRIGERLGAGGMGVVYQAIHEPSDTAVAIKVLREGATDQRFREEGDVLARLNHPGLVGVVGEGEFGGNPFLALVYVPGPTLRELLELGPLQPGEVARVGADLARTLAYVHEQDIVHRDVKPSNVLIAADGRPVLNDFGVSYRQGRTRWTATGFVNGTAAYLAPEQVRGDPPTAPLDIYALGLVLLECLSGFPEYDGPAIECAVARLHRPPRRPHDAPGWLADILMRMTATDPAARPTALEAAELLASEGQVTTLLPKHRGRAKAALLAGAATVAAAGLVAAVWLPGSAPSNTTGEPLPTQLGPAVADPNTPTHAGSTTASTPVAKTVAAQHSTVVTPPAKPGKTATPQAVGKDKNKDKDKPPPGHGPGGGKGKGKNKSAAGSPSSDPAA